MGISCLSSGYSGSLAVSSTPTPKPRLFRQICHSSISASRWCLGEHRLFAFCGGAAFGSSFSLYVQYPPLWSTLPFGTLCGSGWHHCLNQPLTFPFPDEVLDADVFVVDGDMDRECWVEFIDLVVLVSADWFFRVLCMFRKKFGSISEAEGAFGLSQKI
jgi:hypothetical protein